MISLRSNISLYNSEMKTVTLNAINKNIEYIMKEITEIKEHIRAS